MQQRLQVKYLQIDNLSVIIFNIKYVRKTWWLDKQGRPNYVTRNTARKYSASHIFSDN